MRFDEVELETVAVDSEVPPEAAAAESAAAPRLRRLFALLTDLSLFAALAVGLSPLLPEPRTWIPLASLGGFVFLISFYYFVAMWMVWGKTIGGAIFDVRVISASRSMSLKCAALRWAALYLSVLSGGLGFLLALLPSRKSLADRMSSTRVVSA